jgi:hypothetical protein
LSKADARGQTERGQIAELERERMASGAESSGNGEKRQRRMRQRSGWLGWNAWPAGEIRKDRVRDERVETGKETEGDFLIG